VNVHGTPDELYKLFSQDEGWSRAYSRTKFMKGQLLMWQRALLYTLARGHNKRGCRALEIGTLFGNSAGLICHAMDKAEIVTLNPAAHEAGQAALNLAQYHQITVKVAKSWDYWTEDSRLWDFIFVDGDHNAIARDLPWFSRLNVGGMIVFHDYSPKDALIPCYPVYDALNDMAAQLGRPLDVVAADTDKVGMAGLIRNEGETWPPTQR
jgi:predicted O-methyltransferase YrrM